MSVTAGTLGAAPADRAAWFVGAAALAAAAALLWLLHDRFWWAPDEGVYAYVGQSLLQGARLHAEIQDLHPGYVQLAGAAALWLFGEDLVSLRYPLIALTLLTAGLVYRALLGRGLVTAVLGALVTAGLTLPLFLNPTANWYAVLLALALAALLSRGRPVPPLWLGLAVGLVFLFRQLTGVFLGAAVLLWLIDGLWRENGDGRGRLAPLLLLATAVVLALYLAGQAVGLAWLLFGPWPLALLCLGALHLRPADRVLLPALARLIAGLVLAALPLVLWHGLEGSLGAWLTDSFLTPWRIAEQEFLAAPGYSRLLAEALAILRAPSDAAAVAGALLWLVLLALPLAAGLTALIAWRRRLARGPAAAAVPPLLLFAPFLALVAVHYQIPVYLFFALAPLWLALLAGTGRSTQLVAALFLPLALWTQAAQPLIRPLDAVVAGRRIALDAPEGLPRASLAMQSEEQALYRSLLAAIAQHSSAEQSILALPMNPELYFLAERRPPVSFFAAQLGLASPEDLEATLAAIEADPPVLLIHRPDDKYNGPLSDALLDALLPDYRALAPIGPFRLYLRSASSASLAASERSRTR